MAQPEPPRGCDPSALGSGRGRLLAAELALSVGLLGLLVPAAAPTLGPVLLQVLAGGAALGGHLLRPPLHVPHGACLDVVRAAGGALVSLAAALAALAVSRDALAATTLTLGLLLATLFAFDAVVAVRSAMGLGQEDTEET